MTAAGYRRQAEGLRERNKRTRTGRILQATRELLRERDAQTLTLEQIADRAEVAPGTVFNLVGPRERLFAALIDQAHEQIRLFQRCRAVYIGTPLYVAAPLEAQG